MKRRDFFINSTAAASCLALPFVGTLPSFNNLKIGVLVEIFKAAGYTNFEKSAIVNYYASFKSAYQDLLDNKIDVLISSPELLSQFKPEFSLLNLSSSLPDEASGAWAEASQSYVSEYHAQFGLHSESVGSLSNMIIRMTNLDFDEVQNWKSRPRPLFVFATGVEAVIFNEIGMSAKNDFTLPPSHPPGMAKLTYQLWELSAGRLQLTGAYSPALFLNALATNQQNGVKPCAPPLRNLIMVDRYSRQPGKIEIIYKPQNSNAKEITALKKSLSESLKNDEQFQRAALDAMLTLSNFEFADSLPENLGNSLHKYQDFYLSALKSHENVNLKLVTKFESLKVKS
jgi:hypothetical protein